MKEEYFTTVEEFKSTQPASKLIKNAFKEITPNAKNMVGFLLSVILGILFAASISKSKNTVPIFAKTLDVLITIELAVFACVFSIYSILLAFLSDNFMKRLAKIPGEGSQSELKERTVYYESVLFLYFIVIGITGTLILFCKCVPEDFRITPFFHLDNYIEDNVIAFFLLSLFYSFSFRVFYEIKSTIYNTIVLFRASIAYRFLDFARDDGESKE